MKSWLIFLFLVCSSVQIAAQQNANRPTVVAGIRVNYEEDSVGSYTLPELLRCANGQSVTNSKIWSQKRRPELVRLLEELQFGKAPAGPKKIRFDVTDKGTLTFNGKGLRKQVTIYLTPDTSANKINLLLYVPAATKKPAPVLLNISFIAYNQLVDDIGLKIGEIWKEGKKIKADQPSSFSKMNVEQFLDAGIGFATFYYGDIEPDFKDGFSYSIRRSYLKPGQDEPAADEWGAIAAWSWGLSRILDYFETDRLVDSKRVALQGASRLGKTVLWAGARDTRFKVVVASISGEGGAALTRRNYGETIGHITDPSRYLYQFAKNYRQYAGKTNELPFDAHMLVALMAPRRILLQTGSTDYWSDPKGEYLSAVAATPVYQLFGENGPSGTNMPSPGDTSFLFFDLGYYMHEGGHTVLPQDWTYISQYLKRHL